MNEKFSCPYCGQDSYAKGGKKHGVFLDWVTVQKHISSCCKNNKTFLIDKFYGPIHIEELTSSSAIETKLKYPQLRLRCRNILKTNRKSNLIIWTKELIIDAIKSFHSDNGKIPISRDFDSTSYKYPSVRTVRKYFGSWNSAIEAAGFVANVQNGYGIDTYGKDKHLYRSAAEAHFADTYLHNRYQYIVEPKYPEPYNKYYDWYIPLLDLYIELDGGIRPIVVTEKIAINNLLGRKCLFIDTSSIYNKEYIQSLLK